MIKASPEAGRVPAVLVSASEHLSARRSLGVVANENDKEAPRARKARVLKRLTKHILFASRPAF